MAIAAEQLEAIQQEIEQSFAAVSEVEVVPHAGTPPETYHVTYHRDGLHKNAAGAIESAGRHTVSITIPFGYPHFPPSCKPLSPIFHPDFDPAAICIGDFWEKNRSISDLITHIGEMIGGRIYSTANAFNEEAAQWYSDNPERLPGFVDPGLTDEDDLVAGSAWDSDTEDDIALLADADLDDTADAEDLLSIDDELSDSDRPPAPGEDGAAPPDSPAWQAEPLTIEGLKLDQDFAEEATGTDDKSGLAPAEFGDNGDRAADVAHLRRLAANKRFFGLQKELSLLAGEVDFEDRQTLAEQASAVIAEAQKSYNQAIELEHQGKPADALERFQHIETIVSDYPRLQDDIDRVTQALQLLGDWTAPSAKRGKEKAASSPDTTAERFRPAAPTFFDDTPRRFPRAIIWVLLVIVLTAAGSVGFFFYLTEDKLAQARESYDRCRTSLEAGQFAEAERACEAARDMLGQITVFKQQERDALSASVERTLDSEPLRQGLLGNLLLDGRYLPETTARNVQSFRLLKSDGDSHFSAGDWQQAVANYEQALQLADEESAIDRDQVLAVAEKLKAAEFYILYESGKEFIERQEWQLARKDLNDALEELKPLAIPDKDAMLDAITSRLRDIDLATERERGDAAFGESRWSDAAAHYKKALAEANRSPRSDERVVAELKELIVKADLYDTVTSGKTAFQQAQWDNAIDHYEAAIRMLETNRDLLKQASSDENRRKLARIMLQASVIRDKQEAAKHLKEQRFEAAQDKLQAIIDSVAASDFSSDPEFTAVSEEARQAMEQAEADRLLADKISYLETNFEQLFTRHYSGSPPESLVDREVVFERKQGDTLIFRLQCVEVGRGRPLQLVMKYAHDLNSGTWRFYSDS